MIKVEVKYYGKPIEHSEIAILKNEGYTIPSSMISKKPFRIKLNIGNPIDDKEIKRISEIIIKILKGE